MRRSSSLGLASILALVGCAFEDGQPWGEARFAFEAAFEVTPDRLDGDAIRTSTDYRVHVEAAELSLDAVILRFAAAGGAIGFDPADPPAGYSLCHNGHCHSDDGRLVDYADIDIELASGGPSVGAPVTAPVALTVNGPPVPLALGACADGCDLPRGAFSSVEVQIRSMRFVLEVSDRRADPRIEVGRRITLTLDAPVVVTAALTGAADRGAPVNHDINGRLRLGGAAFDGLDWQTEPSGAAIRDALLAALELEIR